MARLGLNDRFRRHPRRYVVLGGALTALGLVAAAAGMASAAGASAAPSTYNFGSGYSAIDGAFTSVTANWIEPTASCGGGNQQTGYWIGLSGTGTIAQLGTATNCDGTTPDYYSWWEMYPDAGVPVSNVTEPGDHMHASVVYDGDNNFTMVLMNVTRGWTLKENKTQVATGGTPISANIIVEANSDTGAAGSSGNVTDFGSVTFGGITVNGEPLRSFQLWTGNLVDMRGVQEDSVSALTGGGRKFTVTWLSNG
ncbi:MAG TPA: G1 family glutamic endopeptidase [Actinospica sp.]|nr:G1 family glutamic endopeptidase [Actinospica sp.]